MTYSIASARITSMRHDACRRLPTRAPSKPAVGWSLRVHTVAGTFIDGAAASGSRDPDLT